MTRTRRQPRFEILDGRDYLVAPITLMVPGVRDDGDGAALYDLENVDADAWNGMPLLLNHPAKYYGEWVTGRSPEVIERYGLGFLFNAAVTDKLAGEGWFSIAKTRRLAPRLYRAIARGKKVEVSAGIGGRYERTAGVHNATGEAYSQIVRDCQPDHVAILTSGKGVFSVRHGCGVNA